MHSNQPIILEKSVLDFTTKLLYNAAFDRFRVSLRYVTWLLLAE